MLFFATDRPGGKGDLDIWLATRGSGDFDTFSVVAELNSPQSDTNPWVSPDLSLVIFASDRAGNLDLYFATR
jgi:Tol biopolymer transport system component